MKNIFKFFKKDDIGEPPWDYYFLLNLDESEYPKYLAKIFKYRTGENLPLEYDFKNKSWIINKKRCKTFNQKIQWLKLYDATDLKRRCTDKVLVRDYVAEKIGEEYLKPVLQVIPENKADECSVFPNSFRELSDNEFNTKFSNGKMLKQVQHDKSPIDSQSGLINKNDITTYFDQIDFDKLPNSSRVDFSQPKQDVTTYFDQIDFDKLPNSFVIKCNHGCKWQYIIKDKEAFLQNKRLFDLVKKNITGWLEQEFWCWQGFELQYKNIEPKILIEPLLREDINIPCREIQVYCFNGKAKVFISLQDNEVCIYDEKLNVIDDILMNSYNQTNKAVDDLLKQSDVVSSKTAKNFKFVRIDFMVFNKNLYFEELTFTPYSGFFPFCKNWNIKLGNLLKIGGNYEF